MGKKTENQASVAHFSFFSFALLWFLLPLSWLVYSMKPVFKGELFDTAKNVEHLRLMKDKWGNSLLIISVVKHSALDKQDEFSTFFSLSCCAQHESMKKYINLENFPYKSFSFYFPQQKVFFFFHQLMIVIVMFGGKIDEKKTGKFPYWITESTAETKSQCFRYSHSFSFPPRTNAILLYNRYFYDSQDKLSCESFGSPYPESKYFSGDFSFLRKKFAKLNFFFTGLFLFSIGSFVFFESFKLFVILLKLNFFLFSHSSMTSDWNVTITSKCLVETA